MTSLCVLNPVFLMSYTLLACTALLILMFKMRAADEKCGLLLLRNINLHFLKDKPNFHFPLLVHFQICISAFTFIYLFQNNTLSQQSANVLHQEN